LVQINSEKPKSWFLEGHNTLQGKYIGEPIVMTEDFQYYEIVL
jgi:hypothetical protein